MHTILCFSLELNNLLSVIIIRLIQHCGLFSTYAGWGGGSSFRPRRRCCLELPT